MTSKEVLVAFIKERIFPNGNKKINGAGHQEALLKVVDTLYEIPQGGEPTPQINYSTKEQDTGLKWLSGEPIFQKTIEIKGSGNKSLILPSDVGSYLNISEIIAELHTNTANTCEHLGSNKLNVDTFIEGGRYSKILFSSGHGTLLNVYVTIRYTKYDGEGGEIY